MSSLKVLRNKAGTTVIESGYQMYIDTTLKLDSRAYGTFATMYDPMDEDLFFKKVSGSKDITDPVLLRDPTDGVPRYLHIINLSNKDKVIALSKLLCFTYAPSSDSRTRLIETSNVVVLDYTAKSVAIFTKDPALRKKLKEYEEKKSIMYNARLTGPKMETEPGYIISKGSKQYAEIIELVDNFKSEASEASEAVPEGPKGNGIEQTGTSKSGKDLFQIWGEDAYIVSKLEELDEEESVEYNRLTEKKISGNRKIIEIELFSTDE